MSKLKGVKEVILNKKLWINIAAMIGVVLVAFLLVNFWLRGYTNHGQQLELPDYVGTHVNQAIDHAEAHSFQIVITDSLFIVGKEGGEILSQTPTPLSKVKEGRKIFVTISKFDADKISVAKLPVLYGKNFERKRKELKQGYELNAEIVGTQYDPGPAGHIMSVIYKGDTIITRKGRKNNINLEKGEKLEFILSKKGEGKLDIPDLLCLSYREARFLLESYDVDVQIFEDGGIEDLESSYIWRQQPAYAPGAKITMGSLMEVYVTQHKPSFCPESRQF